MEEVSEVVSEEVTSEENPEDPSDTEKKIADAIQRPKSTIKRLKVKVNM